MIMVLNNKYEIEVGRFTREYLTSQGITNMRAEVEINENLQANVTTLLEVAKAKTIIESIVVHHHENEAYNLQGKYGLQDVTEHVTAEGVTVVVNFSELE